MHPDAPSRRALLGAVAATVVPAGCIESGSTGSTADEAERPVGEADGAGAGGGGADGSEANATDPSSGSDAPTDGEEPTDADAESDDRPDPQYRDVAATLEDEPLAEQFDCDAIDRPTSDVEGGETVELEDRDRTVELVGALPYPETPAERPEGDVLRDFVVDHESAYQRNSLLDEDGYLIEQGYRLYSHDVSVTVEDVERRDGVTFVLASVHSPTRWVHPEEDRADGTGQQVLTALYALDDSGTARQPIYEIKTDQSLDDEVLLSIVEPSAWELVECR